jgi:hypothetical protein
VGPALPGQRREGALVTGDVRGDTLVYQLSSPPVAGRIVYRNTMVRDSNDRIRWRFEQSDDGGREWRVSFDGFYVRKKD